MSELWIPGLAAAPQHDLVERIHRRIERFAGDAGVEKAFVVVELADGSRIPLDALSPEPGFGFVTLIPHPDADEDDLPDELIVPVGLLRRIELARAEEQRAGLGFSVPPGA